jgi:lipid-A-disaccharide synthase
MVNLIAGEEIVPELIQANFTPERVTAELRQILPDGPKREKMLKGLQKVRTLLQGENDSNVHPAERAAQAVLQLCSGLQLSTEG